MNKAYGVALVAAALTGCGNNSSGSNTRVNVTPVAELTQAVASPRVREENIRNVRYAGKWEFVTHRTDGRFKGASVRSFHPGDAITIVFSGHRLRIYGIRGKNGGLASVVLPGKTPVQVSFYAPEKETHVLLYDSGTLDGSVQAAGLVVTTPHPPRVHGYVNVDEMEALPR